MTFLSEDLWSNGQPWSEQYRLAGEEWADAEAAAQLLEDTKSAVMAQWQTEYGDLPVNKAEQMVKASARWRDYVQDTVTARKEANKAKVRVEYMKMKFSEWNNSEANARAERKL